MMQKPLVIGSVLAGVIGVLYMLEMSPSQEDGTVELGSTQVLLIARCNTVFNYMSDLTNYPMWFPGIVNMTEMKVGPMENGKKFEEIVEYPIIGDIKRPVYVINYVPPHKIQFIYDDWSMVGITITAVQKSESRCLIEYFVRTRRTSYLYHVFAGVPFRIAYSMRGRHAMFVIRSKFNNPDMFASTSTTLHNDKTTM